MRPLVDLSITPPRDPHDLKHHAGQQDEVRRQQGGEIGRDEFELEMLAEQDVSMGMRGRRKE